MADFSAKSFRRNSIGIANLSIPEKASGIQ